MNTKYSYAVGPDYPTDNTMILHNNHLGASKEYLIESGAWAVLSAIEMLDSQSAGGSIYVVPDVIGDLLWFACDDDMVEE